MKTKIFLSFVLLGLFGLGCGDTVDNIGGSIQPDEDKIKVFIDTITVEGETLRLDSIYAKSITGLLGTFYDPQYGTLKASYACQYYPSRGFDSIDVNNKIDSIRLNILYTSYFGDSLSPMEVSVYPVVKMEKNYYTNTDPALFCDMNSLLGRQSYSARDLNISDSANLANISTNYKVVSIPLPLELGQKFLKEYQKSDYGAYASPEAMAEFFPGTYLVSTFGRGCILNVEGTSIYFYYTREYQTTKVDSEEDSIYSRTYASILNVTKEVLQLNNYVGANDELLLQSQEDKMYLKTPVRIYPQITIPMMDIIEAVGDRKFSSVRLDIGAYLKEEREYAFDFPGLGNQIGSTLSTSKLLLIEADSVKTFFEAKKTADNKTSFFTTFNSKTYSYTFENISNVIQNAVEEARKKNQPPKDLKLLLIPVQVSYYTYTNSYSYTSSQVDITSSHYLYPSAVTLKKNLKIEIVAAGLK
ncbi:MAG: DUF4270 domain-containing protein [Dysgonamonadaceae bacterium]|jgi:hypothetical protein|nr:DUF4270 domain-containing protein [Dysgonamonadaceae bacterium]